MTKWKEKVFWQIGADMWIPSSAVPSIISYRPLGKQMSKLKVSFVPVGRTAFAIRLPSEFHTHLPSLTSFDLSPLEALKVWTTSPSPSCSPPTLLERLSDFIIIRPYPNHIIFLLFSIFRIILNNTFGWLAARSRSEKRSLQLPKPTHSHHWSFFFLGGSTPARKTIKE